MMDATVETLRMLMSGFTTIILLMRPAHLIKLMDMIMELDALLK
jgi:hypothetical protein